MIKTVMVSGALMLGISSAAGQDVTFSWSGVIPAATSVLNKPFITQNSQPVATAALFRKQENHPQLVMKLVVHKATKTEMKILKAEL